jgi:hypothetical protein
MRAVRLSIAVMVASCGGPAARAPQAPAAPPVEPVKADAPAEPVVPAPPPAKPALPGAKVTFGDQSAPPIKALVFTDDGTRLVGSAGGQLVEIEVASRRELARVSLDSARVPDPHARIGLPTKLGRAITDAVWAWDARAGELIGVMTVGSTGIGYSGAAVWRPASSAEPTPIPAAVGVNCTALAISPDRTRAALRVNARKDGSCDDANAVQVFDLTTQLPVTRPIEVGRAASAAFSSDGQLLAIGSDRARILDLRSGAMSTAPPSNQVWTIGFVPATSRVVWRTTHQEIESWQPGAAANADLGRGELVAFSPDGKRVAVARSGGVELLDGTTLAPTGETLADSGHLDALAFSDDGRLLAGDGAGATRLWELAPPPSAPATVASRWFARLRPLSVPMPRPLPPITRDGIIEGRVLVDGKPVIGAEIELRPARQEYPDAVKLRPVKTRTGAGGKFRFARLPTIEWHGSVRARGALPGGAGGNLREQRVVQRDLDLPPAATLVGKVLGPDGRPARGVRLYHANDHGSNPEVELTARPDGTFVIDHLYPGGNYRFIAWRRDGAVRTTTVQLAGPGELRTTVTLAAAGDPAVVRGTVVDKAGAPVADALVSVGEYPMVKTDAAGAFTVDVRPGAPSASLRVTGARLGVRVDHIALPLAAPLKLVAEPY